MSLGMPVDVGVLWNIASVLGETIKKHPVLQKYSLLLITYIIPRNALHYSSVFLSLHMFRHPCAIFRGVVESELY